MPTGPPDNSAHASFWTYAVLSELIRCPISRRSGLRPQSFLNCDWPRAADVLFSGPYAVRQAAVAPHIADYSCAGPVSFGAIGISGRLRSLRILLNCVTPLFISSSNWVRRVRI
jgi:hypothetical protein